MVNKIADHKLMVAIMMMEMNLPHMPNNSPPPELADLGQKNWGGLLSGGGYYVKTLTSESGKMVRVRDKRTRRQGGRVGAR